MIRFIGLYCVACLLASALGCGNGNARKDHIATSIESHQIDKPSLPGQKPKKTAPQ